MSFLLRNRSGHGSGRSSSGRNDNRIIPRAPSQSHRQTKISRTSPAGVQMGNQVLIQRTTCSQLTKQQAVAPTNSSWKRSCFRPTSTNDSKGKRPWGQFPCQKVRPRQLHEAHGNTKVPSANEKLFMLLCSASGHSCTGATTA